MKKITLTGNGSVSRLPRYLITTGLLFIAASVSAQTLYVQPSSEVPVRRGQGTDYKITAIVSDGTAVTMLGEKEGWAKVRLKNGKQGWILKRYLSKSPPLSTQIAGLTAEKQQLMDTIGELQNKYDGVTEAHNRSASELSTCIVERTDLQDKYLTLERDTMEVVQTKEALLRAEKEIETLKRNYDELKIANSVLKKNESIKWFLAGTGVLLVGWIMGKFARRSPKKKSSLLS